MTFVRGPDPIGKPGGQYVLMSLLSAHEESEIWEKMKDSRVNFWVASDDDPPLVSAVAAEPPSDSRVNEAATSTTPENCQPTTSEPVVAMAAIATMVEEWLMDTACPADLIDEKHTSNIKRHVRRNPNPPVFSTANGQTRPTMEVPITIPELNCDASPHVMKDSPNVLTIGYRVVEEGYGFRWDPYSRKPILIRPDGVEVELFVRGYCPYLRSEGAYPAMAVIVGKNQPKQVKVVPWRSTCFHPEHSRSVNDLFDTAFSAGAVSIPAEGECLHLGAYIKGSGIAVSPETYQLSAITRRVNDLLAYYSPGFRWNNLRIYGSSSATLKAMPSNLGSSMVMMFGDFEGGGFVSNASDFRLSKTGMFAFFDPKKAQRLEKTKGTRYCVIAHQMASPALLSEEDKRRLCILGFRSYSIAVEKNLSHGHSTTSTRSGTSASSGALSEGDYDDAVSVYSDTGIDEQWADAIRRDSVPSCSLSAAGEQSDTGMKVAPAKKLTREEEVEQRKLDDKPLSVRYKKAETESEHATSGDDDADESATGDDHERPQDEGKVGKEPKTPVSKGSSKVEVAERGEEGFYVIDGDEPWLENPNRDLKKEALSLRHQLLHDGNNPHCPLCKEAKMIRKPCRKRTDVKMPEKFGDVVTCDHVYAHSEELEGITGDRDLLVVYDLATGCLAAYPVKNKNVHETAKRLTHFRGRDTI